jgi:hypothetical protein
LALAASATRVSRTDDATKEAFVELASASPASNAVKDEYFDVTITLSAYEGVWRDVSLVTEGPTAIISPSQTFTALSGLGAPIADMSIFIRGVFGQFTLTDSGGSWLKTTMAWAGSSSTGLLYVGATGQAFLANESNPFLPVNDVSERIEVSGNGGFQITSKPVAGNPSVLSAELNLITLTQTSVTFRVQGKRAYRMN